MNFVNFISSSQTAFWKGHVMSSELWWHMTHWYPCVTQVLWTSAWGTASSRGARIWLALRHWETIGFAVVVNSCLFHVNKFCVALVRRSTWLGTSNRICSTAWPLVAWQKQMWRTRWSSGNRRKKLIQDLKDLKDLLSYTLRRRKPNNQNIPNS